MTAMWRGLGQELPASSCHLFALEPTLATTGRRGRADAAQRCPHGPAIREAYVRGTNMPADPTSGSGVGLFEYPAGAIDLFHFCGSRKQIRGTGWAPPPTNTALTTLAVERIPLRTRAGGRGGPPCRQRHRCPRHRAGAGASAPATAARARGAWPAAGRAPNLDGSRCFVPVVAAVVACVCHASLPGAEPAARLPWTVSATVGRPAIRSPACL